MFFPYQINTRMAAKIASKPLCVQFFLWMRNFTHTNSSLCLSFLASSFTLFNWIEQIPMWKDERKCNIEWLKSLHGHTSRIANESKYLHWCRHKINEKAKRKKIAIMWIVKFRYFYLWDLQMFSFHFNLYPFFLIPIWKSNLIAYFPSTIIATENICEKIAA